MKNRSQQATDIRDIETQPSPSHIDMKQTDFKIVLDDFPKSQEKLSSIKLPQRTVQYIARMIDKIRILNKKKKIPGEDDQHETCHFCQGLLPIKLLLFCSQADCERKFCFRCANKKFDYNLQTIHDLCLTNEWTCISCQNICDCKECEIHCTIKKSESTPKATNTTKKAKKSQMSAMVTAGINSQATGNGPKKLFDKDIGHKMAPTLVSPVGEFLENPSLASDKSADSRIIMSKKSRSKTLAKKFVLQKRDHSESDSSDSGTEVQTHHLTMVQTRHVKFIKMQQESKDECHMCHHSIENSNSAKCSVDQCQKYYCCGCIRHIYQADFDLSRDYNIEFWICYSCGGACECIKCKRRRNAVQKSRDIQRLQDELLNPRVNRKGPKLNEKRRIKYYDTLSEEEEEERQRLAAYKETFRVSLDDDEEYLKEQRKYVKIEETYTMNKSHADYVSEAFNEGTKSQCDFKIVISEEYPEDINNTLDMADEISQVKDEKSD